MSRGHIFGWLELWRRGPSNPKVACYWDKGREKETGGFYFTFPHRSAHSYVSTRVHDLQNQGPPVQGAQRGPRWCRSPELSELSVIRCPLLRSPSHLVIFPGHLLLGPASHCVCTLSSPTPSPHLNLDCQVLVSMSPPFRGLSPPTPPPTCLGQAAIFKVPGSPESSLSCILPNHILAACLSCSPSWGAGLPEGRGRASFTFQSSAPTPCSAKGRVSAPLGPRVTCSAF